jgi:hypothetical protein
VARIVVPAALTALLAACSAAGPAVNASSASGGGAASGSAAVAGGATGSVGVTDAGRSGSPAGTGAAAGGGSPGVTVGGPDSGPPLSSGTMNAAQFATHLKAAVAAARTAVLRTSGAGSVTQGVMRYGDHLAMSLTMTASGRHSRVIMLGDVYYMDIGEKVQGRSWLKIDPKGKDQLSKSIAPMLAGLRQQTDVGAVPASYAGLTVTASPGQTVDGVHTVNYSLRQNSKQLIASLPAAQRSLLASALAGMSSVTTFAVGPDWLPRRVVVVTTTKGKKSTMTIAYTRWGQPVTITAPPASDVITGPR